MNMILGSILRSVIVGSRLQDQGVCPLRQPERIPDRDLHDAIVRAETGLIDADLGGGVIKQRLRREGAGKSGGFRSIVLFRRGELAFFVYGFARSERDNITRGELAAFRTLADTMLALDGSSLAAAVKNGTITEIMAP